ncbi:hypothetical protein [Gynuella sp.]|uniref:hypothetical protein n=1 Tax=Gynuella sp. TaxID=2969146 RepID=UPI003D10A56E
MSLKTIIGSSCLLLASYGVAEKIVIIDTIADIEVQYTDFWSGDFDVKAGRFAYDFNWAIDTNGAVGGCPLVTKNFEFFGADQTQNGVIRPKLKFVNLSWKGYWQNYLDVPMMNVRLQYDNQVGNTVQVYHWIPIKQYMPYLRTEGDIWYADAEANLLLELPETHFTGGISNISVGVCNLIGGLSMTLDDVRLGLKDGN